MHSAHKIENISAPSSSSSSLPSESSSSSSAKENLLMKVTPEVLSHTLSRFFTPKDSGNFSATNRQAKKAMETFFSSNLLYLEKKQAVFRLKLDTLYVQRDPKNICEQSFDLCGIFASYGFLFAGIGCVVSSDTRNLGYIFFAAMAIIIASGIAVEKMSDRRHEKKIKRISTGIEKVLTDTSNALRIHGCDLIYIQRTAAELKDFNIEQFAKDHYSPHRSPAAYVRITSVGDEKTEQENRLYYVKWKNRESANVIGILLNSEQFAEFDFVTQGAVSHLSKSLSARTLEHLPFSTEQLTRLFQNNSLFHQSSSSSEYPTVIIQERTLEKKPQPGHF